MLPVNTDTSAGGDQQEGDLERPDAGDPVDELVEGLGRARPGCTRYQWPRSMASVTEPRECCSRDPGDLQQDLLVRRHPRGNQAHHPDHRRDETSRGGNPAVRRSDRHRELGRSWRPPGPPCAPGGTARRPRPPCAGRPRRAGRWTRLRPPPAKRCPAEAPPRPPPAGDEGPDGHQPVGDPQQPAVPDADVSPSGGDLAEQQPAGRPLEED